MIKKNRCRANKIICILLSIFTVFMIDIIEEKRAEATNSSEIVMEVSTNRILDGNNYNQKMFMASTTKILTAITIIENCNLDDIVTVTENTVGVEGSSIYLEAGEKLSVKDLLYGLMLRSGNDCAETLAVYCSNTIENFAILMNQTAKRIGANSSNFVNPHGLHDDNHYTTAYDLALISCYAMKNNDFRQIVSTKSIQIPWTTREYPRVLVNKNKMLKEFEGSTGIKTGFTKKAGRCLVSSSYRNGMEIICVVLNCPPMFERSKELLTKAFNEYEMCSIFESDYIVDFIEDKVKQEKIGVIIKNDIRIPLTKTEKENLILEFDYPKTIDYSINSNKEIGKVNIYSGNNLIFTEKLFTII